jgi:hypothetical protein
VGDPDHRDHGHRGVDVEAGWDQLDHAGCLCPSLELRRLPHLVEVPDENRQSLEQIAL